MTTPIDRLYGEFIALKEHLDSQGEISLRSSADENYRKALILSAASYFETRICDDIHEYVEDVCEAGTLVPYLVKNKAINSRMYSQLFDWKGRNANQFFSIFGEEFKKYMIQETTGSEELKESIKAFLEVGNDRNRLVHQNFASFVLEKTAAEIFELYQTALYFVDMIPTTLRRARTGGASRPRLSGAPRSPG